MRGVDLNLKKKIGIIICDRYRRCAGGKYLRAMRNKEGAFSIYAGLEVELVGFTTCDGCPGGTSNMPVKRWSRMAQRISI
jgi:predicted metal-binding protein